MQLHSKDATLQRTNTLITRLEEAGFYTRELRLYGAMGSAPFYIGNTRTLVAIAEKYPQSILKPPIETLKDMARYYRRANMFGTYPCNLTRNVVGDFLREPHSRASLLNHEQQLEVILICRGKFPPPNRLHEIHDVIKLPLRLMSLMAGMQYPAFYTILVGSLLLDTLERNKESSYLQVAIEPYGNGKVNGTLVDKLLEQGFEEEAHKT